MSQPHFTPAFFGFFRELSDHNTREWFAEHKPRYERDVLDPLLRFVSDLEAPLTSLAPHIAVVTKKQGGSLFRLHRDTRFSKDKSPYKTNAAAHFQHVVKREDRVGPGFYVHLAPGGCFGGGGIYHPDTVTLSAVRDRIATVPEAWSAVLAAGITVQGESLKRPPAGYEPTHPHLEWLKLKDFFAMDTYSEVDVCAPDFLDGYLESCRRIVPLMRFLAEANALAW